MAGQCRQGVQYVLHCWPTRKVIKLHFQRQGRPICSDQTHILVQLWQDPWTPPGTAEAIRSQTVYIRVVSEVPNIQCELHAPKSDVCGI